MERCDENGLGSAEKWTSVSPCLVLTQQHGLEVCAEGARVAQAILGLGVAAQREFKSNILRRFISFIVSSA
jgi:hypothetical protein